MKDEIKRIISKNADYSDVDILFFSTEKLELITTKIIKLITEKIDESDDNKSFVFGDIVERRGEKFRYIRDFKESGKNDYCYVIDINSLQLFVELKSKIKKVGQSLITKRQKILQRILNKN